MQFHLGKPILAMLILAVISGIVAALRPAPPHSDITLWVFRGDQAEIDRELRPGFESETGKSFRVDLIGSTAINMRLHSLILSGRGGAPLPDATEIEIGGIGAYLRPPVDQVGLLPLNDLLARSGWREIQSLNDPGEPGWNARFSGDGRIYAFNGAEWHPNSNRTRPDAWIDRILPSRLAPFTKDQIIFGIPHDVHPVTLTYRGDLFRQAGIDLAAADSWQRFWEACLAFQRYWTANGNPLRHALELPPASADYLLVMLLQRHVNLVDDRGQVRMNDPIVVDTIAFYAQLAGGNRKIGGASGQGANEWIRDLEAGNVCCFWTPDWKADEIRQHGSPELLKGKLRMMPLPKFRDEDAPTASWGGTMIGIPRRCAHPDEAWKLIQYLYFSDAGLEAQARSHSLPALPERWSDPIYQQPDPLFGGQRVDQLYVEMARQIPVNYVTPVTTIAQIELSAVVSRAVEFARNHDDAILRAQIGKWLAWTEADVRRRVAHATFDEH